MPLSAATGVAYATRLSVAPFRFHAFGNDSCGAEEGGATLTIIGVRGIVYSPIGNLAYILFGEDIFLGECPKNHIKRKHIYV